MLIPPSETKARGGSGLPLDLSALSFPELRPTREALLHMVIELSKNLPSARRLFGVPASLDLELLANTELRTAPTLPAIHRYTGVLFDALAARSMSKVERARVDHRLTIASAPFGLLRPGDLIPGYRFRPVPTRRPTSP